jgi:hypothetical protein
MGIAIRKTNMEVLPSVETSELSASDFVLIEKGRDNSDYLNLIAANVPNRYWKTSEDRLVEMSPEEKAVVDAGRLVTHKRARRSLLERQANSLMQSKYTMEQQQTISYLMDEAERLGLNDRYNYFNQVGTWAKEILGFFYTQDYYIRNATTIEAVDAVSVDFSAFLATDPNVIIGVGSQIMT